MVGAFFMAFFMFTNAGILAQHGTPEPNGIDNIREATTSVTGAPAKAVIACTYLFVASFAPSW